MADRIVVIGGSNIDYIAKSNRKLIRSDSNPGRISISYGGVGRNVAENLARLGNHVTFITGIGNDLYGKGLVSGLESLGVSVVYSEADTVTSSYVAIHGPDGNMDIAICDARALDALTISFIKKNDLEIRSRDMLVMETNLSDKIIADLFHIYPDKKWLVEAVSISKVMKLAKYLPRIYLLKGNATEIRSLAGTDSDRIRDSIQILLNKGVKNIVVTDGAEPVCCGNGDGLFDVEVPPVGKIVNATGAGDALFAGIVDKLNVAAELKDAVSYGIKLAGITLESSKAVAEEISRFSYNH